MAALWGPQGGHLDAVLCDGRCLTPPAALGTQGQHGLHERAGDSRAALRNGLGVARGPSCEARRDQRTSLRLTTRDGHSGQRAAQW